MSENFTDENNGNGEESFAELFESYNAGMTEDLQIGDKVTGEVISIGMDTIFVNTGTKIDGAVEKAEMLDENGELSCAEGDTLDLYVVAFNENEVRLSRALSGVGGFNLLNEAYAGQVPVEGKVIEQCKGGFHVQVFQHRAFCPISQIDIKYVETPEDYVGGAFQFLIKQLEKKGRNIVVSRRELLAREQKESHAKFLEDVNVGDVLDGRVANIMPYGAFVELFPGLEGMVHISELSWSRVEKPEEVVAKDDPVRVKILSIEEQEKEKDGKKEVRLKISLSIKQVTDNPWDREEKSFRVGDKIRGKVTRLMGFGAFVELEPGIEGLVHISEMSYTRRINRPEDVVSAGETVDVVIRDINYDSRRISLSIRDAEGDPWGDIEEKYTIGQSVEGTVEKKEKFGYFVTLEPGITGLLPKSKMSRSENPGAIEKIQVGEPITIIVEEIQADLRKITLAPTDARSEGDWRQFSGDKRPASSSAFGDLGDKLQAALKGNKK
ncbi:30S ribosomal protein S1 [Desulfonema ishimotonii]|uniref:30S ribosomal protein S1 n=1 Tax=Desulfonema ishimotonii TaxID=45657 RepID=A0A401G3J3_9BACT|nr:30S ribosomal protein S1 [Desulfonema ishimotonii]GBC63809.1 30S ribosomal protein S1 [Desulfonema ishimotonii]